MPRPSQGVDRALLEAGLEEIKNGGVRGLSVRAVCARAGVNVRMLNYYFGSKDEFVRQVLTKTYEHFFSDLRSSVTIAAPPMEQLNQALRVSVDFAVRNRKMSRSLWLDANAGVPLVLELVENIFLLQTNMLFELLYRAWKEGDLRQDVSPLQIFTAVIPGVFAPCMWPEEIMPRLAPDVPPEYRRLPDNPVENAMQNFTRLMEGFLARPVARDPSAPQGSGEVESPHHQKRPFDRAKEPQKRMASSAR